jgi:hypothetical protein
VSLALAHRLDPDGRARFVVVALGMVVLVGLSLQLSAPLAVGLASGVALIALVIGLHSHGLVTALAPFAVVAVLLPLNGIRPTTGVSIGDIALVLAGIATLPFARRAQPPGTVVVVLIGTFLVTSGGLLGMAAAQAWYGVPLLLKFVAGAPMVIVIVTFMNPRRHVAEMLLLFYALGGVISSVGALLGRNDPAMQRASGFGAHLGHLGLAAMLGGFVLLGWFCATSSTAVRVLAAVGGLICVYGMLLTGMRSAVLGTVVGLIYVAACARLKGIALLAGGAALGVGLLIALAPYLPMSENLMRIIGRGERSGLLAASNEAHLRVLFESLDVLGTHPWTGVGFGEGLSAHNLILQTVNLGGLIALIGLIVIWGTFFLVAFERFRVGVTKETIMRTCLLAAVIGYLVIAQFEPLIWDRHLWFFITLTLIAQRQDQEPVEVLQPQGATHDRAHL